MRARHPIVETDLRELIERCGDTLDELAGRSMVITGATGMIPAYLVETVAWLNEHRFREPCRLTAVVRRLPMADGLHGHLLGAPGIHFLMHDARTVAPEVVSADYLVLAATKGSPRHYLTEPIATMELNGGGLAQWLDRAAHVGSRAVLYVSSGEIYGTPDAEAVPTPESYVGRFDHVAPRAVYGESKRFGEALSLAYLRERGVPVKIVRPFQVFGPGVRADDGRALADFAVAAARGEPIRLDSPGHARRTFMYLADAVVAMWQVLLRGAPGCIYNIGTSTPEVTILQLAERIAAMAGGGCRVEVAAETSPTGQDSPQRTAADIGRLQRDFGFAPRIGLDEMLRRILDWLRDAQPWVVPA